MRRTNTNPNHKSTILEIVSTILALFLFGFIFGGLYWLSQQDALQYYQDHIVQEGTKKLMHIIHPSAYPPVHPSQLANLLPIVTIPSLPSSFYLSIYLSISYLMNAADFGLQSMRESIGSLNKFLR